MAPAPTINGALSSMKVSALLEHDPAEVIQAFAWVYGEDDLEAKEPDDE